MSSAALYRILDANLDRAREGLRVVEEWCRFGLNQAEWTEHCKAMRQELAKWHLPEFRAARDTPGDLGTQMTHPQEAQRDSIAQVLQANLCRIEESLRVLEEYGKVHSAEMGAAMKQMRYKIYTLDSQLQTNSKTGQSPAKLQTYTIETLPERPTMTHSRHDRLHQAQLYLVTSPCDRLIEVVESALQGGLTLVQYRDKNTDDGLRFDRAQKLKALCQQYGALFIVNDRVDLALSVDADGVHLGQQDLPYGVARQILGPDKIIGRSTTNPEEFARAMQEGADYIGVGPVHETPTKAGKAAAGYDYVRYATENCAMPWFAIGGIDLSNVQAVIDAGARRVSVVRAVMEAENPQAVTQQFLARLMA
ncbi:thiamine phosphate synthase [Alkalinema sp. FACHB-956]|uniref:thiamine phosphate synthase n=1 Tax=Alkalinema sp. FACHB-956 TaxID=2692768 RepID=UPI0016882C5C|nr:thiamine phosphate synthase [Alkalinema sp. FACHB-956]MBD2327691.1 thiamine phosphate synthase [Alkalinema sp. FACHB-956]